MAQNFALKTLKQFGGSASAGNGGIAQFGSLKAGSPVFTTDPNQIQALTAWAYAWANAVISGNNAPALEDMNAVMFVLSYMLMYNQQEGVTEWNAAVTYNTGSIVKTPYSGTANTQGLYMSLQDSNLNQALPAIQTNNAYWAYLGGGENDGYVPTGTVHDFAGSTAPAGYLMCDGSVYAQATYPALYNVIGATFNIGGEGAGNFRVPDAQGRTSIGAGAGTGLTNRTVGPSAATAAYGEETHALTVAELAQHNHGVTDPQHNHGTTESAHSHSTGASPNGDNDGCQLASEPPAFSFNGGFNTGGATTGLSINNNSTGISINNTGSGNGHNNMQPWICFSKIIKI